ncbi:hypothetical protein TUMSATVNIG1_43280 [Vibrio nigripulchritudo]|uniref:hypothetical protein n=1 Tax=Vibrio nigripulchritudo TaxID=28173 RepID=UPI00190BA509|nr:hypothetical protein [Vibrio nigripulchritudo]BCL72358.1 hypothetical protein VNTUMSATTG_42950 [Vibrio nigripulchritudo]BDU33719.1 hypothetical protein TUMSATVNIG1_43280 [Vibrio nigripulchritudo]
MHETKWRELICEWMRSTWPRDIYVEEAYTPYGTDNIHERLARPDILRFSPEGGISIVEVKKWGSSEFKKWAVLDQLQLYTFLTETQYLQDNENYFWMQNLIKKGLLSQSVIDHIENRLNSSGNIVDDWCIVIVDGKKDEIEQFEILWHMYDFVNLNLETNSNFRPLTLLHVTEKNGEYSCDNLECWFWENSNYDNPYS